MTTQTRVSLHSLSHTLPCTVLFTGYSHICVVVPVSEINTMLNLLLIKLYMKTEAGGYYPDKEDILIDQGLKLHGLFRILRALLLYKLLRTVFYFKLFIVSNYVLLISPPHSFTCTAHIFYLTQLENSKYHLKTNLNIMCSKIIFLNHLFYVIH